MYRLLVLGNGQSGTLGRVVVNEGARRRRSRQLGAGARGDGFSASVSATQSCVPIQLVSREILLHPSHSESFYNHNSSSTLLRTGWTACEGGPSACGAQSKVAGS